MNVTGDQYLVKKINKSIVLDKIRTHSPLSRARLSELTGLNKGTVSSLVGELIESDLVREIGPGASSGGRKPLMLLFNGESGYAIGIEIRIDSIDAVLTDLSGAVKEQLTRPLLHTSFESVYIELKQCVTSLMEHCLPCRNGVVGIGIGVPGIVDAEGNVLFAPNLGWRDIPLKARLQVDLGLPVIIDNEANAGAMGERIYGAGKEASHLLYLSVGYGIGSGIIIHNELYKGASGYSGEAGHLSIHADGKRCSCGSQGCWELYASENALLTEAKRIPRLVEMLQTSRKQELPIEALCRMADQGDEDVHLMFERIGGALGVGIASLINVFNPELVVIGNRMALAKTWIASPIEQAAATRSLSYHRNKSRIVFSELALNSTVLGASYFAVSQFLSKTRVTID